MILQQDIVPQCAFVVKKGVIGTYSLSEMGDEHPVGFGLRGKFFPLGWLFGKTYRTQYYYRALSVCEVFVVPKDDLLAFLETSPRAMSEVLSQCVGELVNHEMRINALSQSKASDKVLRTIHYLSLCFGRDLKTNVVEIPIPLTQTEIANLTGLTRETVGAELRQLTEQGIVSVKRRRYIVLTNHLNRLLDDEYEQQLVRESVT
jgi:CRP/FNR family transcriptional regulator